MNPDISPPPIMIDLIKVSKNYPPNIHAISDVSLTITKGELVFLIGMSGAGKTTLLRLISRMERPSKGMVDVAGMDVVKLSERDIHLLRRKVGMAYQDFKLLPERTVADNIAIALEVVYCPRSLIETRIRDLLDQLDLTKKYHTRAGELSRGEQQRVSIARAVANNPDIILADEPTGNLDAETTARVMALFEQHHRKGATLIIATHDRELFQGASHRIVELRFGRILSESKAEGSDDDDLSESEIVPALLEEIEP